MHPVLFLLKYAGFSKSFTNSYSVIYLVPESWLLLSYKSVAYCPARIIMTTMSPEEVSKYENTAGINRFTQ